MENTRFNNQDRISWIRDLVHSEEQVEESGIVDMGTGTLNEPNLMQETLAYLQDLKTAFIESASAFNELKASPLGRIKIYGIAKTHADFMLFRNGFKMIFSAKAPGQISIRFNFIGTQQNLSQLPSLMNTAANLNDEVIIESRFGPFQELRWTYQNETVNTQSLVKYHLSLFIKESQR